MGCRMLSGFGHQPMGHGLALPSSSSCSCSSCSRAKRTNTYTAKAPNTPGPNGIALLMDYVSYNKSMCGMPPGPGFYLQTVHFPGSRLQGSKCRNILTASSNQPSLTTHGFQPKDYASRAWQATSINNDGGCMQKHDGIQMVLKNGSLWVMSSPTSHSFSKPLRLLQGGLRYGVVEHSQRYHVVLNLEFGTNSPHVSAGPPKAGLGQVGPSKVLNEPEVRRKCLPIHCCILHKNTCGYGSKKGT